ncbi:hypothetical protein C8Q74DRAFT_1365670 [Fomes fomentarius]|nr:hypothetical protein C8Q74DRAFT_1365670 [Fomes fomentarius]
MPPTSTRYRIPSETWEPQPPLPYYVPHNGPPPTPCIVQYPSASDVPDHLVSTVVMFENTREELRKLWPDGVPESFTTPSPPRYKIESIKGFGRGMIATTNITRGQLIVRERPLLVMPISLTGETMGEILAFQEEVVNSMRPANRAAVYALTNVKGPDWPSHLKGILDTNSIGLGEPLPGYAAEHGAVARDISRVNHSCSPNAEWDWDLSTLTLTLRSKTPIRRGEQVTVCYVEVARTYGERQEELCRRYKFVCKCKACSKRQADRDLGDMVRCLIRIQSITDSLIMDDEALDEWVTNGAPTECGQIMIVTSDFQEFMKQFESMNGFMRAMLLYHLMKGEMLFPQRLHEAVLARLVKACSVMQEEEDVRKYALEAALMKKARTGSDGGWADVARYPRQTDWWGKRASGSRGAEKS